MEQKKYLTVITDGVDETALVTTCIDITKENALRQSIRLMNTEYADWCNEDLENLDYIEVIKECNEVDIQAMVIELQNDNLHVIEINREFGSINIERNFVNSGTSIPDFLCKSVMGRNYNVNTHKYIIVRTDETMVENPHVLYNNSYMTNDLMEDYIMKVTERVKKERYAYDFKVSAFSASNERLAEYTVIDRLYGVSKIVAVNDLGANGIRVRYYVKKDGQQIQESPKDISDIYSRLGNVDNVGKCLLTYAHNALCAVDVRNYQVYKANVEAIFRLKIS